MRKTYLLRYFICSLAIFIISGCATAPQLQTPSGRPEVTIQGSTKKEIIDVLVNAFLSKDFELNKVSDYSVVFTQRDTSFAGALRYGSRYDSTPERRIVFNLVETGNAVRVFCSAATVTNPGSAFERANEHSSNKNFQDMQNILERLKARMER